MRSRTCNQRENYQSPACIYKDRQHIYTYISTTFFNRKSQIKLLGFMHCSIENNHHFSEHVLLPQPHCRLPLVLKLCVDLTFQVKN